MTRARLVAWMLARPRLVAGFWVVTILFGLAGLPRVKLDPDPSSLQSAQHHTVLDAIHWLWMGAPNHPVLVKAKGLSAKAFQDWLGKLCFERPDMVRRCLLNLAGDLEHGAQWLPDQAPTFKVTQWSKANQRMELMPASLAWMQWLQQSLNEKNAAHLMKGPLPATFPPPLDMDEEGAVLDPVTGERMALLFPYRDPVKLSFGKALIETLNQAKAEVIKANPGAQISYSGFAMMVHEEGQHLQERFPLADLTMLLLVGAVILVFFPYLKPSLRLIAIMAVLSVVCIGMAGWMVERINAISMSFVASVLGLGVNEGVYLLVLAAHLPAKERLKKTAEVSPALFVTALTTMAGFGSLAFTDVKAFQDLGKLAAFSLGLCMLFMVSAWPHLMGPPVKQEPPAWSQIAVKALLKSAPLLGVLFVLPVMALGFKGWPKFDASFLSLMPDLPAVRTYLKEAGGPLGSDIALLKASTPEESDELAAKAESMKEVKRVLALRRPLSRGLGPVYPEGPNYQHFDKTFSAQLQTVKKKLDDLMFEAELSGNHQAQTQGKKLLAILNRTAAMNPAQQQHQSKVWDAVLYGVHHDALGYQPASYTNILNPKPYVYLLYVRPKEPLLEEASFHRMEKALANLGDVESWMPARLLFGFTLDVKNGIPYSIAAAFILAVLVIGLGQKKGWNILEAVLPLAACLAGVWGLMAWFDWLGPVSIAAIPILVATCVDGPVMVRQTLEQEGKDGLLKAARGLALTQGTTAVAFGSLTILTHPGVSRLGFLVAYGVTAALVYSLWWTPLLFKLRQNKEKWNKPSSS